MQQKRSWCCLYSKDTISKAIHNLREVIVSQKKGVAYTAKIQFRKQFTTMLLLVRCLHLVLLIQQRYNFESNSQHKATVEELIKGVAYTAKIQFRKQFTTYTCFANSGCSVLLIQQRYNFESNSQPPINCEPAPIRCCLYSKDTISKAIHNSQIRLKCYQNGVAYTAKIQFRKQFTTDPVSVAKVMRCCLYSKDTISKAIHNHVKTVSTRENGVAYTAKIQFRKQFTTQLQDSTNQWKVLLIQQRYNFESNSQRFIGRSF